MTQAVTGSIVTALRERKRGRVAVELDDRSWRVLPTDAVVRAGLTVGRPLDRATARELAREVRRAKALTAATRSLAARDRSKGALERRLARAGHPTQAREEAIASLARAGALDDGRLAETRASLLARRGYGDAAIRADLGRRLVAPEAAAAAIASLEPEPERLRRILESETVSPALLRRLAGRGFSRDTLDDVTSPFAFEA
ncbi:MAG TPA: RecX family transcriptional regulator [Gaiellaceae bacterium]